MAAIRPTSALAHCRVLVVEDEYMLAEELAGELIAAGATVLGPVPSIEKALELLETQAAPDCAILDINLGGDAVFPLADNLLGKGVPLVFTTGYDPATLPPCYAQVPTCGKPISFQQIASALRTVMQRD